MRVCVCVCVLHYLCLLIFCLSVCFCGCVCIYVCLCVCAPVIMCLGKGFVLFTMKIMSVIPCDFRIPCKTPSTPLCPPLPPPSLLFHFPFHSCLLTFTHLYPSHSSSFPPWSLSPSSPSLLSPCLILPFPFQSSSPSLPSRSLFLTAPLRSSSLNISSNGCLYVL